MPTFNEKLSAMEGKLLYLKNDIEVIQTSNTSWTIETETLNLKLCGSSRPLQEEPCKNKWNKREKKAKLGIM